MTEESYLPAPKAREFYTILVDKESLIKYLMDNGIIAECMVCTICTSNMHLITRKDVSDKKQWKCSVCLTTCSIRKNSIFEKSKLPLEKLTEILYYYGMDFQIFEIEKLVDVNHGTVVEWFKTLREMSVEFLKNNPIRLGESMGIVEIDESLYGKKRKYNRGTGRQDTWVFGMVEKGTRNVIFHVVEKRNRNTLLPIIKENTVEGSTIHSDCWAAYNTLCNEGFIHKTVNHSKEFKSSDGTCTNDIEGLWGITKNKIKKMKGVLHDKIGTILHEFSYRYRYGFSNGDVYRKLISDIGKMKK